MGVASISVSTAFIPEGRFSGIVSSWRAPSFKELRNLVSTGGGRFSVEYPVKCDREQNETNLISSNTKGFCPRVYLTRMWRNKQKNEAKRSDEACSPIHSYPQREGQITSSGPYKWGKFDSKCLQKYVFCMPEGWKKTGAEVVEVGLHMGFFFFFCPLLCTEHFAYRSLFCLFVYNTITGSHRL